MIKKQLIPIVITLLVVLSGCGSYDDGYEDGYEGTSPGFLKFSSSYKNGYENGRSESYYFNLGYEDGRNAEEPRYPDVEMYMEGYKEGK